MRLDRATVDTQLFTGPRNGGGNSTVSDEETFALTLVASSLPVSL